MLGAVEYWVPPLGGDPKAQRLPSRVRYSIVRPCAAEVRDMMVCRLPSPRWSTVSAGSLSPPDIAVKLEFTMFIVPTEEHTVCVPVGRVQDEALPLRQARKEVRSESSLHWARAVDDISVSAESADTPHHIR
jgi:hypothetical protein